VLAEALPTELSGDVSEAGLSQSGLEPRPDLNLDLGTSSNGTGLPTTRLEGERRAAPVVALAAPVASEPWFRELGQQVLWQAGNDIQQARLRLNPEDLGPIDVEVRVQESGTEVHFVALHPQTREALEQGLGRLREQLDAAGLNLSAASVGDGQLGRDAREGQDARASTAQPRWRTDGAEPSEVIVTLPTRSGLIDEYA
jgi:flagellar hook-length control protein FliK